MFAIISCNDDVIVYPEGGYAYPKYVEDKDTAFYCYPLKDVISTADSMRESNSYYFLKVFDEYNLSLRPEKKETFRFINVCSMGPSAIIVLSQDEIIVKTQTKGWIYPYRDTTKLTEKEREHFHLLRNWFPLNDTIHKKWRKVYFDSMTQAYPELLDPNYYQVLMDKSADFGPEKFSYILKRIPISIDTFKYIVNKINESGYWQLPYEISCKYIPMDGCGFILEANTKDKYNIVASFDCGESKYSQACQELVKYAKMDTVISLDWKEPDSIESTEKVEARPLQLEELKPEPKTKKKKTK